MYKFAQKLLQNNNTGTIVRTWYPNGYEAKCVKNLGYLLRNAARVDKVCFVKHGSGGLLLANLIPGPHELRKTYATKWASFEVFNKWIKRPSLRNVPLEIINKNNV